MKKMIISIHGINDVYKFIKYAIDAPGDVTVSRGTYNCDARSVMGVLSIDMSQNVTVEYPDSATEFEKFIKQFQLK
jgi:phosphotransferase system HPr-like phosphotransfer protein